jgi:hypothetical protein
MSEFSRNIISSKGETPPENIQRAFTEKFPGAINIEWTDKSKYFEALFYLEQIEYIAIFSPGGDLMEYKMFLPEDYLPANIRKKLSSLGEVMNAVLINKGNRIIYEIIYRDTDLNRYIVYLTNLGRTIKKERL